MTLESLEQLMLAQAQECFWQKAVKDGLKDAIIAKLAAKVSDFYSDAYGFGQRSNSIESEWLHHMNAKHWHFAAASQYRAACDCLEKRRYGEEVARLRDSLSCVESALKEQRYINQTVLGDLNGLRSRVQDDLRRAEKDNDVIYLNPVPSKQELRTLDRAAMVSAKVPKEVSDPVEFLGDQGALGQALFTKLVPYAVHVAATLYADRRDRLINSSIIDELEVLNAQIHEILSSLGLPGSLQAIEKPLGLPPALVSHAEEIKQQDGLERIYRSVQETERLRDSDRAIYREGTDLLDAEGAEDDRARQRYGTDRWTRPDGKTTNPKLYESLTSIAGYLKVAATSDSTISDKIRENERHIRLLGGPMRELEHFVPSTRRVNLAPTVEQSISRLRSSLNEVSRLESRRKRKVEALRQKAKDDNVHASLLKEASRLEREYPMQKIEASQFDSFFEERLKMYDEDKATLEHEGQDQQALLKRLSDANANFTVTRKGDTSTRERERALQGLEASYAKYKEIISNLDQARRFYNDLAKMVTKFRDECRGFVQQRRSEAQQIEADISMGMASLSLQNNRQAESLHQQKQQQQRQQQRQQQAQASTSINQDEPIMGAPSREPLVAPKPQRPMVPPPAGPVHAGVWNPEMPINFAPSGPAASDKTNGTAQNSKPGGKWDPAQGVKFG